MKITRRTGIGTPPLTGGIPPSDVDVEEAEAAARQPNQARDTVSVSEKARLLGQLRLGEGEERAEKIGALRKAVEEGSFQPEIRAVARSFLREVLGFFVR